MKKIPGTIEIHNENELKSYMISHKMKIDKHKTNISLLSAVQQADSRPVLYSITSYAINYVPEMIRTGVLTSANFMNLLDTNDYLECIERSTAELDLCGIASTAVEFNHPEITEEILNRYSGKMDQTQIDNLFFILLKYGNHELITKMVENTNANINARDNFGAMMAAKFQSFETFKYLVEHGLKPKVYHRSIILKLFEEEHLKESDKRWLCQHI